MSNKEKIVQVALELFGQQGYDRSATSQIAQRAGVSEGLIFRHFGSKAGLLSAIIAQGLAQIAATMQAYAAEGIGPEDAILQHIDQSLNAIREQEKFWRLATQMRFQASVASVAGAQIEEINRFVLQGLTQNFQAMGRERPDLEAMLLFAQIDAICLHWLRAPEQYPLEDMKNLLKKKYSHEKF